VRSLEILPLTPALPSPCFSPNPPGAFRSFGLDPNGGSGLFHSCCMRNLPKRIAWTLACATLTTVAITRAEPEAQSVHTATIVRSEHAPDDAPARSSVSTTVQGIGVFYSNSSRVQYGSARVTQHTKSNTPADDVTRALHFTDRSVISALPTLAAAKYGREASCATTIPPPA
jgi:hypothetical protein